jgi:hypothetical protein
MPIVRVICFLYGKKITLSAGPSKGQLVDDVRNIRPVTSNMEVVWEQASLSLNETTCGYAR